MGELLHDFYSHRISSLVPVVVQIIGPLKRTSKGLFEFQAQGIPKRILRARVCMQKQRDPKMDEIHCSIVNIQAITSFRFYSNLTWTYAMYLLSWHKKVANRERPVGFV